MKTLTKLLFAIALVVATFLTGPPKATAAGWCDTCDLTGDCVACCRCEGHGPGYCEVFCNGW